MNEVEVVRNDDAGRFEGRLDGVVVSVVSFVQDGSVLTITHTVTEPAHRGQGLAGVVTRAALENVRMRVEQVRPHCPFTIAYLESHPEFADLRV